MANIEMMIDLIRARAADGAQFMIITYIKHKSYDELEVWVEDVMSAETITDALKSAERYPIPKVM